MGHDHDPMVRMAGDDVTGPVKSGVARSELEAHDEPVRTAGQKLLGMVVELPGLEGLDELGAGGEATQREVGVLKEPCHGAPRARRDRYRGSRAPGGRGPPRPER